MFAFTIYKGHAGWNICRNKAKYVSDKVVNYQNKQKSEKVSVKVGKSSREGSSRGLTGN